MVKVIAKEADTHSTIPSEEISMMCSEASSEGVATISTILTQVERPHLNKSVLKAKQPCNGGILSRKWSPRETEYFYKLLQVSGTDFAMMTNLQVRRSKK